MELYDLDNGGAWQAGPAMPTPRCDAAVITYGANVFVLGGRTATGPSAAVEYFSLITGTWTQCAPLPEAVEGAVGSKLGERMVITGGRVGGHVSTTHGAARSRSASRNRTANGPGLRPGRADSGRSRRAAGAVFVWRIVRGGGNKAASIT